ncbi:MAG: RHS repeat protein [Proteobacteria bacterium]|nr:RHS repeat protein [Pseudomonadota bacterium]
MLTALALLPALALAAPSPVLAPSGPMHIGPLGPDAPERLRQGRDTVDVDLATGQLFVENVDLVVPGRGPDLEVRRVYRGGVWHLSLDDRILIDGDGVTLTDVEGTELLPIDLPVPEGLADDGSWPIGATFDGGRAERTDAGYRVFGDLDRAFDSEGRLIRLEDSRGSGLDYTYDTLGLARVVGDDGRTLRVLHDSKGSVSALAAEGGNEHFYDWSDGLLVTSIGPDGRTRYSHDDDGSLRAVVWPDGSQIRVRRDDDGRVDHIAGPASLRRVYTWTARGVELQNERAAVWRIERDATSEQVTAPTGATTRREWSDGELVGWTAPDGAGVRLERDSAGHITSVVRTSGSQWRLQWTADDLTGLTDPTGGRWRLERDSHGDLIGVQDPEGRTVRYDRDPFGAIVAIQRGSVPWRLERDTRGHLHTIQAPSGAATRLDRDTRGRVTKVSDPSGSESILGSYEDERPKTLLSRGGALWSISYDAMGRPTRVEQPGGVSLQLRRDGLGRLDSLWTAGRALLRFRYRSDGLLTQIEDALGARWGVVGDATGHPLVLRDPDGVETALDWSPGGRLVGIGEKVIERDPHGNPTQFGTTNWTWDALDRLVGVQAPGLSLILARSAAGAVQRVEAGAMSWRLTHDGAGRVIGVDDGADGVDLVRDMGGNVVGVRLGEDEVAWDRDDRAIVYRVRSGDSTWRALHDAEGRATRWTSPSGTALSLDRDLRGDATLVRFPDGTLRKTEVTPDFEQLRIELPTGEILLSRTLTRGPDGRVVQLTETGEGARSERLHRDASGTLVARESDDGAWLWAPGQISAPDGGRVLLDERGQPSHATPPVGPLAWGVAEDVLSYGVDDGGCITELIGESGTLILEYDALGRPTSILGPDERIVPMVWDALGRLESVGGTTLIWGPDGPVLATSPLGRVELLEVAGAGTVLVGDRTVSLIPDDEGQPRIAVNDGTPERLDFTPLGFARQDAHVPIGPGGSWVVQSGPLLDGGGLWDPVSGTRACRPDQDDSTPLGWWPTPDGAASPWWSPQDLLPTDVWHDPLELLATLGELPDHSAGWTTIAEPTPALPWLPGLTEPRRPPILPPLDALPIDVDDELTLLVVRSSLPPSTPFDDGDVLRVLTGPDLAGRPEVTGSPAAFPAWVSE